MYQQVLARTLLFTQICGFNLQEIREIGYKGTAEIQILKRN